MWLAFTLRNGRCFFADLSFRFPVVARAPGLNVEANLIDVVEMREPDAGWGAARGEVQADGAQSSAREPDPQFVSMQDGGFLDQRKRQPFVDNLIGSVKGERLCSWLEFGAVLFWCGAQEQALQLIEPDGVLESNPGQTRKITRHELMGSDFRLRCEHGSPLHAIARSMRLRRATVKGTASYTGGPIERSCALRWRLDHPANRAPKHWRCFSALPGKCCSSERGIGWASQAAGVCWEYRIQYRNVNGTAFAPSVTTAWLLPSVSCRQPVCLRATRTIPPHWEYRGETSHRTIHKTPKKIRGEKERGGEVLAFPHSVSGFAGTRTFPR